ncbi:hypothetical protein FVE85_7661 [Porphyridium purpureum]|uniref:Checkpoint protein n=1 Tax=Porphyridium purpureum TaxID=35688 RepID=A0A5J4Z8H0_PORPP|nr:hypothetical protein FVE85_7661 [Porphyridium purpureum]|eukprot:POR6920..scf295_1
MKFKARLRLQAVHELVRVLQALEKTTERDVVLLLENPQAGGVKLIVQQQPHAAGALDVHVHFQQAHLFEDYRIVSKSDDTIGLSLEIGGLLRALRSAQKHSAELMLVKLSKKDVEVLAFDIYTAHTMALAQDVPVRVLNAVQLSNCSAPALQRGADSMGLWLPPALIRQMYFKADKMRALDSPIRIECKCPNLAAMGELDRASSQITLEVDNELVNMRATFTELERMREDPVTEAQANVNANDTHSGESQPNPRSAFVQRDVAVDGRYFARALYGYHMMMDPNRMGAAMSTTSTLLCGSLFLWSNCIMVHFPFESKLGSASYYVS